MDNKKTDNLILNPVMGLQKDGLQALFEINESIPVYHSNSKINGIGVFTPMGLEENKFIGVAHVFYRGFWYMTTHGNYNHSKNPNCYIEVDENVTILKTARQIKHGEELTVDYTKQKFLEQPKDDWVE